METQQQNESNERRGEGSDSTGLVMQQLAPDEVNLLEKYRAEKEADRLAQELHKTTLLLVSGWMTYHEKTGDGLTWSTFMNDFDCDQYIPFELQKYHKHIYEMLDLIISSTFHKCCEATGA